MNTCALGMKSFGAGDERIENVLLNFSHTHTASYQQLPNKPYVEMIVTCRNSPTKTGGITLSYLPLSTLYPHIRNSVHCCTERFSTTCTCREPDKWTSTYTPLIPSKLVAACNTRSVVQVWPNYTWHAHTIIVRSHTSAIPILQNGFKTVFRPKLASCSSHKLQNK